MPIKICPRCGERIVYQEHCGDIIHRCKSNIPALDNEDVPVVGKWEDYTGSGLDRNLRWRGVENELWGENSHIEGEDVDELTRRGNKASTHRTRQHLEFIDLKEGGEY